MACKGAPTIVLWASQGRCSLWLWIMDKKSENQYSVEKNIFRCVPIQKHAKYPSSQNLPWQVPVHSPCHLENFSWKPWNKNEAIRTLFCQQVAQKPSDLQEPTHQPVLITFYETQFEQCITEIILLNSGTLTIVTWQPCQFLGQK